MSKIKTLGIKSESWINSEVKKSPLFLKNCCMLHVILSFESSEMPFPKFLVSMVKAGLTAQSRSLRQLLWVHSWGNLSLSLCICAEKAQRDWQLWVKALMNPFLGVIVRYSVVTWGRFSKCIGVWKPYNALCAGGAGLSQPHSWGCSQSPPCCPAPLWRCDKLAAAARLRYKPLHCCRKCKPQINSFSTYLKPISIVAVFQSGSTALR